MSFDLILIVCYSIKLRREIFSNHISEHIFKLQKEGNFRRQKQNATVEEVWTLDSNLQTKSSFFLQLIFTGNVYPVLAEEFLLKYIMS